MGAATLTVRVRVGCLGVEEALLRRLTERLVELRCVSCLVCWEGICRYECLVGAGTISELRCELAGSLGWLGLTFAECL